MEDTRERLLGLATSLFAARGYNGVGVREVCEAAGITKPTLYYHFGSKRGLLAAIAEARYRVLLDLMSREIAADADLAGRLERLFSLFLDQSRKDPAFTRLRLTLNFAPAESEEYAEFRPWAERLFGLIVALFLEAETQYGNMKGRSARYAASFIGMTDAHLSLSLSGSVDYQDDDIKRLTHYFMHGLFS